MYVPQLGMVDGFDWLILNRGNNGVKGIYKYRKSKKKQRMAPQCRSFAEVSQLFSLGSQVRRFLILSA